MLGVMLEFGVDLGDHAEVCMADKMRESHGIDTILECIRDIAFAKRSEMVLFA